MNDRIGPTEDPDSPPAGVLVDSGLWLSGPAVTVTVDAVRLAAAVEAFLTRAGMRVVITEENAPAVLAAAAALIKALRPAPTTESGQDACRNCGVKIVRRMDGPRPGLWLHETDERVTCPGSMGTYAEPVRSA